MLDRRKGGEVQNQLRWRVDGVVAATVGQQLRHRDAVEVG